MGGFLAQAFPSLRRVETQTYDVGPLRRGLGTGASVAAYASLAFVFAGDRVLSALGYGPGEGPAPLLWLRDNRMAAAGVFMGLNIVSNQLASSGAFEIVLVAADGRQKTLWSTLAAGRGSVPSPQAVGRMLVDAGLVPARGFRDALAEA